MFNWIDKVGAACGVAAPFVGFIFIFAAISQSPWFSWADNALSDLGVSGVGATIFNSGLIMTGILATLFGLALLSTFRGRPLGQIGGFLYSLGSVFLVMIGVFPETAGRIHMQVSVAFFVLMPLSMLVLCFEMLRRAEDRIWGYAALLSALVAGAIWLAPHGGVAVPEAVSGAAVGSLTAVLGVQLLRFRMGKKFAITEPLKQV